MIEFQNVDFSYGEKQVLRNLSFRIEKADSVVIMGSSGSGKSTILRLILGLECPQRGKVLIHDDNICRMNEKAKNKVRKSIGMVFQDGALFDSMTVGENVGYYLLEHTRLTRDEIEERVRMMLGFVGLDADEIIDKLPDQLSGGMQRRVAIGRALLSTNPTIMLYDEPTTGLDPETSETIMSLINKLTDERAISTIVVTHQIADAFSIANRFMVIDSGQLAFDGTFNELRNSDEPRVVKFLAPFRNSLKMVQEKNFINGH